MKECRLELEAIGEADRSRAVDTLAVLDSLRHREPVDRLSNRDSNYGQIKYLSVWD